MKYYIAAAAVGLCAAVFVGLGFIRGDSVFISIGAVILCAANLIIQKGFRD